MTDQVEERIRYLEHLLLNTTTAIEREDWQDAKEHAAENRRALNPPAGSWKEGLLGQFSREPDVFA